MAKWYDEEGLGKRVSGLLTSEGKVHTMGNSMSIGYLLQNWPLIVTNIHMDVSKFSAGRCVEEKKKTCLNKIKLFCLNYNVLNM